MYRESLSLGKGLVEFNDYRPAGHGPTTVPGRLAMGGRGARETTSGVGGEGEVCHIRIRVIEHNRGQLLESERLTFAGLG